jgi:23S rRNA (cytosine1962-C5)-methyltransferase
LTVLEPLLAQVQQHLASSNGDACRLFHGRGRCFPGLEQITVDYFHPIFLITLFSKSDKELVAALVNQLAALAGPVGVTGIALQQRGSGQNHPVEVAWGELPRKLLATEAGLSYGLQLGGRQNLGFFLDMSEARQWLAARAEGSRVLNLFAYTCAFSVVARSAGAAQVVNLDMSSAALRQGQQNHQRNAIHGKVQFLAHDLFRSWGKLRRLGPFDLLVVDPPSRQPGSFVAETDYRKLIAKLPELCAQGAELLLCLNSPHLESGFLRALVDEYAPQLVFRERLPNPSAFIDENPELSLKVLSYGFSESR